MITLRKRNGERFLVNHNQIECIELIPECKIVMMNHDYYLVKDTVEEIIQKIAEYNAKVQDIAQEVGIPSISTFIRQFKNHTGTTPDQYRKLN